MMKLMQARCLRYQKVSLGARPSWPQDETDAGRMPALPEEDGTLWTANSHNKEPKGWHSRGYMPHFDAGEIPQAITFRLAGSLPKERLNAWREELSILPADKADIERRRRIEAYLDAGHGEVWLADPRIAAIVEDAILYFDSERYHLHAWVIMPNHVHVLITPRQECRLSDIIHSWKSFTAKKASRVLGRSGSFWQLEYFDRYIRNERHFKAIVEYIERNPVKAGLCHKIEEWSYSSASRRGHAS